MPPKSLNLKEVTPEMSQRVMLSLLEDLHNEKEALSQQNKVNFSILEDIDVAQKELQRRYSELNVLKNLVQELGASLKTTDVLQILIKTLKEVLPESVNFAYVVPSPDPGKPSNLVYIHSRTSLRKEYLDAIKENIVLSFDLVPTRVKRREELVRWIRGNFLFEFMEGTKGGVDIFKPFSIFNVPLLVRDEMLGVINISSPEAGLFTEKDINLVNTMVGATASTISRLRQLLESEQSRIQALVDSLSNGVIMFDIDERVTLSNPIAQKMTGLPARGFYLSELVKLFSNPSTSDEVRTDLDKKIKTTLSTGQGLKVEEVNLARSSYEVLITPVLDPEEKIIGGAIILHDITHLKEIDRMKTEFVSVASHQLRTPLTAIKLFIEMLAEQEAGKLNEKQKEYVGDVQKSTERMIKLVNDLLNVSRIETGRLKIEPELIQLEDFIQDIINDADLLAKEHKCRIIFKKPQIQLAKTLIDPSLMRQVIHNLITNAIHYSSSKGRKVLVDLKKDAKASNLLISVKDEGIGIPKKIQSRIFEKFFRADNAQKVESEGSGLGLYVAKMIIEASGGKIWFESEENKGTTFYVSLPVKGMPRKKGEKGLAGNAS